MKLIKTMKNLKGATVILSMVFIGITAVSCKDAKKENTNEDGYHMEANHNNSDGHNDEEATHDNGDGHHDGDSASTSRDIVGNIQKNISTTPIINAYIQIKNALVVDNKDNATNGGKALLNAFSKFDMSKLTGETHNEYMEIVESAKEHAEHIVKSPIDHQREPFESLSIDINDMIKLLGTEKTLYKDFCPMVNNNKGGFWLSEVKDIKNPYFGSKMMKCGSITEQIN